MLKRAALLLALTGGVPAPAGAAAQADLVVGSVRDGDGAPIVRADVRLVDSRGAMTGADRTDDLGTFAIAPAAPAVSVEIRCAHCRTTSVPLADATNVAIVVTRYRALESDVPAARDLAALPYGKPADVFALVPFVLGGGTGGGPVSDRGLGGGRGLASDDGAPLVDLATGTSALADVPDRFAWELGVVRADRAYRYGSSSGGGVFAVETVAPRSRAAADAGSPASLAVAPVDGDVHLAYGVSSDGESFARRADIDTISALAGGTVRAGATSAAQRFGSGAGQLRRVVRGGRLAYVTASRRYRTSAAASANDVAVSGATTYRSRYLTGEFRLERPGAVALAAGLRVTRTTTAYAALTAAPYALTGRSDERLLYAEAGAGFGRASVHGALAVDDIATVASLTNRDVRDGRGAVLPQFDVRIDLGGGAYVRGGYARSLRVPTLLESDGLTPAPATSTLERADFVEGALGMDTGLRLRAEAIAYREQTRGFQTRRLAGVGASVVWQVAPRLSLRAWTLRASAADAAPPLGFGSAGRSVLWATYANDDALRLDAIVHRDVCRAGRPSVALDGAAFVPLAPHLALAIGTTRRGDGRQYSFGIRLH
ncbi:MAG: hypothetical protein NVSMB19_20840 [Vulcanimicrobiaceae bacterium]